MVPENNSLQGPHITQFRTKIWWPQVQQELTHLLQLSNIKQRCVYELEFAGRRRLGRDYEDYIAHIYLHAGVMSCTLD